MAHPNNIVPDEVNYAYVATLDWKKLEHLLEYDHSGQFYISGYLFLQHTCLHNMRDYHRLKVKLSSGGDKQIFSAESFAHMRIKIKDDDIEIGNFRSPRHLLVIEYIQSITFGN